ncbi:MAG TPA: serine/threonine-protein kinase [Myxococcota bacterium]|nr:serine/threonine-protein kinase [Myxococcota bacterium]
MAGDSSRQFGKYHLIAHLATGGMADIYLASHKSIGGFEKLLVIKRILPNLANDKRFVEMFLDEARIAAQLNHPNVIQIFDLGQIKGCFFIAMEYLSGESLSMIIKSCRKQKQPFPNHVAAGIVMQAAEGLYHAHTMTASDGSPLCIVHRDISPQNIFVQYDGGVKVVDFGIAKAADRSTRTRTGTLKGKYAYMSPEQVEGKELDARSDVFALGIVLWESLVGRKLYKQENDLELLKAVVDQDAPSPQLVNPRVSQPLAQIAIRALARRLDDRYQSAAELRNALSAYLKTVKEDADTMAIGRFMQDLFSDRIANKRAIIEGARALERDLGDTIFGDLNSYVSDTDVSVPRSDSMPGASAVMPGRKRFLIRATILVLLFITGGLSGLYLLSGKDLESHASKAPVFVVPVADAGIVSGQDPQPDPSTFDGGIAQTDAGQSVVKTSTIKRHRPLKRRKVKRVASVKPASHKAPSHDRPTASKVPPGKLRLVTTPWSNVYYRGKKLGQTPLIDTELPSGPVKLRVVNKEAGIDRVIVVNIKPGQRNTYRRSLY